MKKTAAFILCFALILCFSITAAAATGITGSSFTATVSPNGNCQVTFDLQVHLDGSSQGLSFPIPANARSVTLNGNAARISRSGGVQHVKLSSVLGNVVGDFNVRLQYTLPNTVAYDDNSKLILTLPILSGFDHPISGMSFSISLPGEFEGRPDFSSGYYQQTIESNIRSSVSGNTISGSIINELKDRETLVMTMMVSEDLFPQNPVSQWRIGIEEILMSVFAGLSMIYWIFFLRCAPFLSRRSTVPPEGYTAGELSGLLAGKGSDLTMMVFSWAQMGYLLIQVGRGGKVTLHKRMDMGNERDAEEVRLFRALFARRRYVDASGAHYAKLFRKAAMAPANARDLYKRSSGNPKVFRLLCAAIGLFSGIALGRAIAGSALLGFLLIAILAVAGGVLAWIMQDWVMGLHMRDKTALMIGLGLAAVWTLLGLSAGIISVTLCSALAQLLCGLLTVYCGRRTVLGRQCLSQTLGFRRYLKTLTVEDTQRILRSDPDYFFTMAPYALALGVTKPFAAGFGNRKLPACPYVTTGKDSQLTADQWCMILEQTAKTLDARQKRLILEQLLGR